LTAKDSSEDREVVEWLTIKEATKRIHVQRATFYKWAKAGRINLYKFAPKVTRVKWSEIEALAEKKQY